MLKVAILDDYQNVSQQFVDIEKLSGKYEIKIFSEPFIDEADTIDQLADFEALLIMRERTPITKNLIDNLTKLKFIITSGMRNKSIDLEATKKRKLLAGIHNGSVEYAKKMISKGFDLVTIGSDQRFMSAGAKAAIESIKGVKKRENPKGYWS